ncbi:hypothetical protein Tco_1578236 [Tanacetum coccineum]
MDSHQSRGKSRSKSRGGRLKCYICQSEDHLKRNCPKNNRKKSTGYVKKDDQPSSSGSNYNDSEVMIVMSVQALLDWIMDSGCSYHITPKLDIFFDFLECDGGSVLLGDNRECKIRGLARFGTKMTGTINERTQGTYRCEKQGLVGKKCLGKYGLVKLMLNSSTGLFSFQFSSMDGLNAMLENVWVKLHSVSITAFNEDGLSAIATKRSSYAKAMIELQADVKLKDTIVVAMPKLTREGFYTCTNFVEYEWKPPRCACCKVFGHIQEECPKNSGLGVAKNLKKPSQAPRCVLVGSKVGFKLVKQAYRPVSIKHAANTSGSKKNDVEPTKKVSNSNPFNVLNSVENDMDLGTNRGTSNLQIDFTYERRTSCPFLVIRNEMDVTFHWVRQN